MASKKNNKKNMANTKKKKSQKKQDVKSTKGQNVQDTVKEEQEEKVVKGKKLVEQKVNKIQEEKLAKEKKIAEEKEKKAQEEKLAKEKKIAEEKEKKAQEKKRKLQEQEKAERVQRAIKAQKILTKRKIFKQQKESVMDVANQIKTEKGNIINLISQPVKMMILCLIIIVTMIIQSSFLNTNRFYLTEDNNIVEVWQGRFAPSHFSKKLVITLQEVTASLAIKKVYRKQEVFPLVFNYYMEKASTLKQALGLPRFKEVKQLYEQALAYATTTREEELALAGLISINATISYFKNSIILKTVPLSENENLSDNKQDDKQTDCIDKNKDR